MSHKRTQNETSEVLETASCNFFPRLVNTFGIMSDQCVTSVDAATLISE